MAGTTSERIVAGRMALSGFAPPLDACWNEWMDPNLLLISCLAQCTVLSRTTVPPPVAPQGSIFIAPDNAPTDPNAIFIYDGDGVTTNITVVQPWPGLIVFDDETQTFIFWDEPNTQWANFIPDDVGGTSLPADLTGLAGQIFVVNPSEDGVVARPIAYDIPLFVGGLLEPNAGIRFLISRDMTIPANLAGSLAMFQIAPDAPLDIDLRRNGMSFGTLNFATGAVGGTFSGLTEALDFDAGDIIEIVFPDPQNGQASGLSVTIVGNQR